MKKFIITILFTLCFINIYAQNENKIQFYKTYCRCHNSYKYYNGYVIAYKPGKDYTKEYKNNYNKNYIKDITYNLNNEDTIVFFNNLKLSNNIKDKNYKLLHYNVGNYEAEYNLDVNKLMHFDNNVDITELCYFHNDSVYNQIANDFKFGFIRNYSWSTNSVNGIDFTISYTNMNKKTIKYIDIYFYIKNPVGDICKILYNKSNIAHLCCVGPIEQFETGTYSWDAAYYTTGDASNLYFSKIVLTFMDNTKYTLVKEITYLIN